MKKYSTLLFLFLVAFVMMFPMAWMLLVSLKQNPEQFNTFKDTLLSPFTFANYTETLVSDAFDRYFLNSILVAIAVTSGNVLFCYLSGYALARKNVFGSKIIMASILGVLIIPQQVIMIPLYRMMVEFHWINSYLALIVPWLVSPFGIFLVKQFIAGLPQEIESAARLDGASEWYVVFRIVMPLCKPVLTVLAIYIFMANWNSFLYPFLFTNDAEYRTVPVGLAFYIGKQSIDWGHLMAGASISALPVLVAFTLFQRQIISGLTAGALKE
ncbi:MAG: carbohydrate ABC transporter permease [Candidatus Kapabacteria bacterium]|nr:carbohydrate ABC transporter permease [Candidatus Kapabacteria bacterium]